MNVSSLFSSLQKKFVVAFGLVVVVTALVLGTFSYVLSSRIIRESIGSNYAELAASTMDKIDRNLFERYGDVQAFAVNNLAREYLRGGTGELQMFMNTMMTTYGIYDAMLIVKPTGEIVMANTCDNTGKTLNTASLLGKNVASEEWFTNCASGKILQAQSYYNDPHFDNLTEQIFSGKRYLLQYAAPVRDADGTILGVWCNFASYERIVHQITDETVQNIRKQGFSTFGIEVLDKEGNVLENEDGYHSGTIKRTQSLNAAREAVAGRKGFTIEHGGRAGGKEIFAYAHSLGALGYTANGWSLLARVDTDEALASVITLRWVLIGIGILVTVLVVLLSFAIVRTIVTPLKRLNDAAAEVAAGNYAVQINIRTGDEIERLGKSFNRMVESIRNSMNDLNDEKAGVEAKVQRAVEKSRQKQQYLETCIDNILHKMEDFANGDFTVQVKAEHDDEIARLYAGFNRAVEIVKNIVVEIKHTTEANTDAARSINHVMQMLRERIDTQSERMDEIAAAVEEMNVAVLENAKNAEHTANFAEKNGSIASDGGKVVTNATEKIREIVKVINTSADAMERLGVSSEQIQEIVEVINGIADQTNLLALNAAIEAARAGEHGRGFAIVADEVRKLAESTTLATKQISGMVKTIRLETTAAVQMIHGGRTASQESMSAAEKAASALQDIVKSSGNVQSMVTTIAAASIEQSQTTEIIARNMQSISEMAQQSASQISEAVSAIERLHDLSHDIDIKVKQFRTEDKRLLM